MHVEKVGSGAGRARCGHAANGTCEHGRKRCRCPLGDPSGLVSFHYCCDLTRGKSAPRFFFEARFPVGACFGGLHLACDCFAVLCWAALQYFQLSFTDSMRAVHVTLLNFSSGKLQVCCHCCSANGKFSDSLFPRLAKAQQRRPWKNRIFGDRILTSEIAEFATRKRCLQTMS